MRPRLTAIVAVLAAACGTTAPAPAPTTTTVPQVTCPLNGHEVRTDPTTAARLEGCLP